MAYDEPFWMPRRWAGGWVGHDPAYNELHDYDFEMRGPYRTGKLLDAYMEWRRFLREADPDPRLTDYELLRLWRAWRHDRGREEREAARDHGPRGGAGPRYGREYVRPRRSGPARGPGWPREGL